MGLSAHGFQRTISSKVSVTKIAFYLKSDGPFSKNNIKELQIYTWFEESDLNRRFLQEVIFICALHLLTISQALSLSRSLALSLSRSLFLSKILSPSLSLGLSFSLKYNLSLFHKAPSKDTINNVMMMTKPRLWRCRAWQGWLKKTFLWVCIMNKNLNSLSTMPILRLLRSFHWHLL